MFRTLLLFAVLSCAAMAQTFNGVSLGGSTDWPTISNQSSPHKDLMAYVVQKLDSNHINRINTMIDLPALLAGKSIQDGQLGLWVGVTRNSVDHTTGKMIEEGDVIGWVLKGVLFVDGTFYGDPNEFTRLQKVFAEMARFGKALQAASPTQWPAMLGKAINGPFASEDQNNIQIDGNIANNLLALQTGMKLPIDRLAALPAVVKGQ